MGHLGQVDVIQPHIVHVHLGDVAIEDEGGNTGHQSLAGAGGVPKPISNPVSLVLDGILGDKSQFL